MEKLLAVEKLAHGPDRPYPVIKAEMQVSGMGESTLRTLSKLDNALGAAAKKELNRAYGSSVPRK